ncbi:beta-propeller domain-containing methanol dehydrogenase [Leptolyngbya sp. Heron Island J]|uniref:photosystem II repair protein Psb32 n=1 Tax=Leptolyngbya sp. Heron Island J TaxID=1385935 RepID=UPI0003B9531D|nr:TPM domain-containing protein [Leptolyngbya sp. Heron Island J]ESA35381.1 beta-propeller domain-containing methanol dehydrogenase [Leptolyngbya sp. Heron Island J]
MLLSSIFHRCRWIAVVAIALVINLIAVAPANATGVYDLPISPSMDNWVLDNANQITRLNESNLNKDLKQLAAATEQEVRYVTIHRLDYGETAQSLAEQLFSRWFPTPEAGANQTIIVLDDVTNNIGIKVGEETSALLSTEIAESITQETMKAPLLKSNSYNRSFDDATVRLAAVLAGEPDPGPPVIEEVINVEGTFATAEETEENRASSTWIVVILLILATVIPMATYYWYQSIGG